MNSATVASHQRKAGQLLNAIRRFPKRHRIVDGGGFYFVRKGNVCVLPAKGYATTQEVTSAAEDAMIALRWCAQVLLLDAEIK